MDGDEEPRSGGVVTVEGAPEGVPADAPAEAPPVTDEPEQAADHPLEADATAETGEADTAAAAPPVAPPTSLRTPRRTYVRRGLAATGVALVVALSVSAFAMVGPTTTNVDQRFVDAARSQGHVVASGDQQTLVVSAARKICDRREDHSTVALRRATALSLDELGAVQQTFATDFRGFTALALDTYCPN